MNSFMQCPACKGAKVTAQIDLMAGSTVKKVCVKCGGVGEIREQQTDGIRCGKIIADTYFWQELKDGIVIATLETRIRPVGKHVNGNFSPEFRAPSKTASLFKKQNVPIPRLYIEIVRMTTKPAFRMHGIMKNLVQRAIADPKLEWAETNLDDSTDGGIATLKSIGFVEEGNKLIKDLPK